MRIGRFVVAGAGALALLAGALPGVAAAGGRGGPPLERQVLGAGDGWASVGEGTTGGAAADAAHVFTVRTWDELRAALGGAGARGDTTPRIVRVEGTIDANGPGGVEAACARYADPAYSQEAFVAAYDPATWGAQDPSGPLEEARARSQANQEAQVRQYIGSNVTLVGVGRDARIVGAALTVRDAQNVIVRNLRLSDAYDCFPEWAPADAGGTWNSAYDNLWLVGSSRIWVDHNTLDDGDHPPSALPEVFGTRFEVHDGLLDITNSADLVTVSWNRLVEHDKAMLIGSSNTRVADRGTLRVTLHHNLFDGLGQRVPRVRFGQVHVVNNHHVVRDDGLHSYLWGVGVESQILAEANHIDLPPGVDPATVIKNWGGTRIAAPRNLVGGRPVDLVAAHNAANDPDLDPTVAWQPPYDLRVDPARSVPHRVAARAGAGRLR